MNADDDLLELAQVIKHAQQSKSSAVDVALADMGSSMSMWSVLRTVSVHPRCNTHELAVRSFLTDQSLGALAAKLADRGLLQRVPGPGRSLVHDLTPQGREHLEQCTQIVVTVLREEFADLDHTDIATLIGLLRRVVDRGSGKVGDAATR